MPQKLRLSNTNTTTTEGKQEMAATPDAPAGKPLTPVNTDDPNNKLLLDNIANQKTSDEKQELRYSKLNFTIQVHKTSVEKYIEENDKALGTIRSNVTTKATNVKALQDSVTQLQTDLTAMQDKFHVTQKLLDDASANLEKYAATISKLTVKISIDN